MLKLNKGLHFNILTIFAIVFVCVYLYYTISDLKKVAVEVKKHTQDIANIATSLASLNKHVEDIKKKGTGSAGGASTSESCRVVPKVTVTTAAVSGSTASAVAANSTASASAPAPASKKTLEKVKEEIESDDDDDDSVDTNDVKNLLSSIPDEHDADDETDDNDDVNLNVEEEEEEDDDEDLLASVENTLNTESVAEVAAATSEPVVETFVAAAASVESKSYKDLSVDELKQQSYDDLKKYCKDNGLSTKGTKDVIIQRIKA